MIELSQDVFPDTNFRNIISAAIIGNTSDWFNSITYIAIPNKNIHSLKGIELFENLEVLEASYNHIISLDLSKNLKLKELYVAENDMEHLRIAEGTVLKKFHCYGNNLDETKPIKALKVIRKKEQLIKKDTPKRKRKTL